MDNILETTRRQNAASSLLTKSKLAGLDRQAAPAIADVDLPEIVIVSVPDLGHTELAPPHALGIAVSNAATSRDRRSAGPASESDSLERIETNRTPLAGPHASGHRRQAREFDSPEQVERAAEPEDRSAAARVADRIDEAADMLIELARADDLPDLIIDDLPSPRDEERRAEAEILKSHRSIAPRRVLPEPNETETNPSTERSDRVATGMSIDDVIIDDRPATESTDAIDGIDAASDNPGTTETSSDVETEAPIPAPTTLVAEASARRLEARERHARTIVRSLFEMPAISDATSLLLVATGGVRRALDTVECLGRSVAWHLDRDVRLTSIESCDAKLWEDLPEASVEEEGNAWRAGARVFREATDRRLTTLELAIEGSEASRFSGAALRSAVREDRRADRCSLWLVDGQATELCEALAAGCDATLMIVDLGSSRVARSRWVVTHLRDHGARIVGSIVVNAFEEEV
ncbi:MAG TPA: hypothetical protein DCQ98_22670 [Planctomycetaceae bacterium]|nr:hypothetical protein [Planctomycetaceae bacterium]HRF01698.1 hypothetical protein [Pirellulaceae bacterium]